MISGDCMAENYGFALEKQRAVERMRELNARAKYRQNAAPPKHELQNQNKDESRENAGGSPPLFSGFNLPFLGDLATDSDMALILGILLILTVEKSDKLLLLALLYILI